MQNVTDNILKLGINYNNEFAITNKIMILNKFQYNFDMNLNVFNTILNIYNTILNVLWYNS